jgi:hypothetical protein
VPAAGTVVAVESSLTDPFLINFAPLLLADFRLVPHRMSEGDAEVRITLGHGFDQGANFFFREDNLDCFVSQLADSLVRLGYDEYGRTFVIVGRPVLGINDRDRDELISADVDVMWSFCLHGFTVCCLQDL